MRKPRTPVGLIVRMYLAVSLLALLVWGVGMAIATAMNVDTLIVPIAITVVMVVIQYLLAPWIIRRTMQIQEVNPSAYPSLYEAVREMAAAAQIPMPAVEISNLPIPNAFAYGRSIQGGHVCVTKPLLTLLNEDELRAVIGHEIMHLKSRDVVVMSLLSMLPNVFYYLFRIGLRMRGRKNPGPIIALAAILAYFVAQLLVLFVSRVREYAADQGSVDLGNPPHQLASALFKLVYGAAELDRETMAGVSGYKALFASDPSKSWREISDLADMDLDRSGNIDPSEMTALIASGAKPTFWQRIIELVSTHPNMLARIRRLAAIQDDSGF